MMYKLFSNAYARMRYLRFNDIRPFLNKVFNVSLSFLMIFTLAFVTIETIDPEPVFASGEFNCVDSDGRTYIYQSTWAGGTLTITRGVNNDSGTFVTSTIETFSSWSHSNIDEVNSLSITTDGEMFAVLKKSNGNAYLYKLNYNASGAGTASYISSVNLGSGDNNAGSNYEVDSGGSTYKYIFTSKGFFNGNTKVIRVNGDGTYKVITPTITNGSNGSNKAKDFAWVSNHPSGNDFVGYDSNNNDLLGAEITSHTNIGNNSEAITIDLSVLNGNIGSGIGSNSGAAMSLGNGDVYFLENSTGDLWLYDESAGSLTETNDDFNNSSNTDGAGCGIGLPGSAEFLPTLTAAQGSCSGSNKTIAVTLNNEASTGIAANFVVTYTIGGSTSNLVTGAVISEGSSNTSFSVPAQANGTSVQLNWYAESSTYGLRTPSSGTSTVTITVDASDCVSIAAVSLTDSQSLGSCSAGSATSTLSLQNSSGSTAYVTAEYSTNGGSSWTVHTDAQEADNLTISNGQTNTSLTVSVPDDSAIQWRYKSSNTSGNWTGLSYITANDMNSATVDCPYGDPSVSQSLGSCSSGAATSIITLANSNSANTTVYFLVEYSLDGGSNWTQKVANQSVGTGTSTNFTQSVPHDAAITWRYKTSTSSGSFSGSYTTLSASSTVDCPVIDVSASQSLGSCSSGSATSTLTLSNSNSANDTAYFLVEYSLDGGSNWTQKAANQSVAKNASATLTQSVSHDAAIQWRYKSSSTSGSFSGSYVTSSDMNSATVDCPYIDPSVSQSLGGCSAGSATSTLTIANSNSATVTAYFYIRYKIDSGNWVNVNTNKSVAVGGSATFTQSVPDGSVITWSYLTSSTSNTFSGGGTEVASSEVDCLYIDPSASQALGSCSAGAKTSTLTLANSNSANTTAYFLVEYSLDGGSNWTQKAANQSVAKNASATLTHSVPHNSAIQWRYKSSSTS